MAVSYTHLDVYKRQHIAMIFGMLNPSILGYKAESSMPMEMNNMDMNHSMN